MLSIGHIGRVVLMRVLGAHQIGHAKVRASISRAQKTALPTESEQSSKGREVVTRKRHQ